MSSAPLLLALDTSTATASVALYDGEHVLSESTWLAGREHSTRLLVEIDVALDRVGRTASDLTGLVVACGPGSFTGVRVALSVAKGIAFARGLPLWGVNSLEVVAACAEHTELPVRAVLAAGRGRFATALYVNGQCVEAPRLTTLDQLLQLLSDQTLVVGEIDRDGRARVQHETQARVASVAASLRRAGFLAEIGWQRALAGDLGDARVVDAIYVS
jgi:tRNA threonylcarbamoyladenosine biosynthesis protein TsaB